MMRQMRIRSSKQGKQVERWVPSLSCLHLFLVNIIIPPSLARQKGGGPSVKMTGDDEYGLVGGEDDNESH